MAIWFGIFSPRGHLVCVEEGEFIASAIATRMSEPPYSQGRYTVAPVTVERVRDVKPPSEQSTPEAFSQGSM